MPDLAAASDSGSSNTDNITKHHTRRYSPAPRRGAAVQLLEGEHRAGQQHGRCVRATGRSPPVRWPVARTHCRPAPPIWRAIKRLPQRWSVTIDTGGSDQCRLPIWRRPATAAPRTPTTSPTSPRRLHRHGRGRATVQLLEGSTVLGSATADGAGNWTITCQCAGERRAQHYGPGHRSGRQSGDFRGAGGDDRHHGAGGLGAGSDGGQRQRVVQHRQRHQVSPRRCSPARREAGATVHVA